MTTLFERAYDGESIVDIYRDVSEAIREKYNPLIAEIPTDEYGFKKGTFTVKVEWSPEGGIEE